MKKVICVVLLALVFNLLSGCSPSHFESSARTDIPLFEPKNPVRIALVLGGGGSKGLAHLGAIQELEAAGIRPDLIVGCSAGAIIGALYADQPELEGVPATLLNLKRDDLLDYAFFKSLFGLFEGKRLEQQMQKHLHVQTFEELKIPLIVVATDLINGDVVELSSGDIAPAVRASCAYPGFFKPVPLHGRYLVDGGAACPIPVSIAKKYGAEIVIVIDLSEKLPKANPRHLFGVAKRSLEIAYLKFVEQSLAQADIVIKMHFDEVGTFADHLNEHIYAHGREITRSQMPEVIHKLAQFTKDLSPQKESKVDRRIFTGHSLD